MRIMEHYGHGGGVATYLARYLRGGPLKNSRLVGVDPERVCFTSRGQDERAGSGGQAVMRLAMAPFFQRLLRHVPVPGMRVVRSYGLYHHGQSEGLAASRSQLGQLPLEAPAATTWHAVCARVGEQHPEQCPPCGRELVPAGVIARRGSPPTPSVNVLAA